MRKTPDELQTVGLIGGMSWHSTATYYRIINQTVADRFGGHASARIALQSLDFSEIRDCQVQEDWDRAAHLLTEAGSKCLAAGADTLAICTNLMHKVAPQVEAALGVSLLHIGDAVGVHANRNGWGTVGILGTQWVMDETFYADRLEQHGVGTVMPDPADRPIVDRIIWDELTQGRTSEESRAEYVRIVHDLADRGADAVVLACTEIGLLIQSAHCPIPVIDSADVHAEALGRAALDPAPRVLSRSTGMASTS